MLVLTRKVDECILVDVPPSSHGTRIKIAYLDQTEQDDTEARIGIEAPRRVRIVREELDGRP